MSNKQGMNEWMRGLAELGLTYWISKCFGWMMEDF